jgi:hypothetical protein
VGRHSVGKRLEGRKVERLREDDVVGDPRSDFLTNPDFVFDVLIR